jgi:hypothetical protein
MSIVRTKDPDRGDDAGDAGDARSWGTDTLPLAVRKELLQRQLEALGFSRKKQGGSAQQQQQPQSTGPSRDGGETGTGHPE